MGAQVAWESHAVCIIGSFEDLNERSPELDLTAGAEVWTRDLMRFFLA